MLVTSLDGMIRISSCMKVSVSCESIDDRQTHPRSLERRECTDNFIRTHHGTGVVWDVDFKGCVHVLVRVTRGRVFHHRDLVAKLSTVAYGRLHTRMRDESDDNELMNAVLLELQIQIGVGKAAGTPVLEGHDVARLRRELAADLAAPGPVLEGLMRPGRLLDGSNVLPGLVVARAIPMMQRIEDAELRLPRRIENLQHVWNTVIRFCDGLQAIP